jgi:hypothetical protein
MTVPQTEEEMQIIDKIMWDFLMKKASNNLTLLNERGNGAGEVWVAGETDVNSFDLSTNPREQTYPSDGMMRLVHPMTRAPITPYRPGEIILPQQATFYKYPLVCVMCNASRKKRKVGDFYLDMLLPVCENTLCAMMRKKQLHLCLQRGTNFHCTGTVYKCSHGYTIQIC